MAPHVAVRIVHGPQVKLCCLVVYYRGQCNVKFVPHKYNIIFKYVLGHQVIGCLKK